MTYFCVLNEAHAGLYCPQPFHAKAIGMLIESSVQSTKGQFAWQDGQETFLGDYHELFLEPKFFAPRWIVIAAQPRVLSLEDGAWLSSERFIALASEAAAGDDDGAPS